MKRFILAAVFLTSALSFGSCKKDDDSTAYTVTAYAQSDIGNVSLFVNNENKGQLPYIAAGADDCNDSRALNLALEPGVYTLVVKNQEGEIKNTLVMNVSEDGDVTNGNNYTFVQIEKCILLGID